MVTVKDACIFYYGENANGYSISNPYSDLKEKLINVPVVVDNIVIGVVTQVNESINTYILGDVTFWKDEFKDYRFFKNYEVDVENVEGKSLEVKNISYIELSDCKDEKYYSIIGE